MRVAKMNARNDKSRSRVTTKQSDFVRGKKNIARKGGKTPALLFSSCSSSIDSSSSNNKDNQETNSRQPYQIQEESLYNKEPMHYPFTPNEKFNKKYMAVELAGEGTFSRVFKVKLLKTKKTIFYAMKILKPIDYINQLVQEEIDMLKNFQGNSEMLQLIDHFYWRGHYCLVFDYLSISISQLLLRNQNVGFPITGIQVIAKCLLQQLAIMHSKQITHTDLKTDNLVFCNHNFDKYFEPNEFFDEDDSDQYDWKMSSPLANAYYLPRNFNIKIIDFGSATHENQRHSRVINTRQYRAPEIILQSEQWDMKSDMWAVGCILMEIYTGTIYFRTHEDYEHLAMIEKICGPIPRTMIQQLPKDLKPHFSASNQNEKNNYSYFNWPQKAKYENIERVNKLKLPRELIHPAFKEFRKLIDRFLQIKPKNRVTACDALKHKFFSISFNEF